MIALAWVAKLSDKGLYLIDDITAWLRKITIHILLNISQIKGNQTIKFGELIECNKRNIYFKNHAENKAKILVPDIILFFKKALYEVKRSGLQLGFTIF